MEGNLDRLALTATLHCFAGCALGEVLGLAVATALGWGNVPSIVLAVALAFLFGYALTSFPLVRSGLSLRTAASLALASDTVSVTVMEIVDNLLMLVLPGAMAAGLGEAWFWGALALSLAIAFVAAYPANRWLIARGRGHTAAHAHTMR
jgi:hypothetical protein